MWCLRWCGGARSLFSFSSPILLLFRVVPCYNPNEIQSRPQRVFTFIFLRGRAGRACLKEPEWPSLMTAQKL